MKTRERGDEVLEAFASGIERVPPGARESLAVHTPANRSIPFFFMTTYPTEMRFRGPR